MTGGGPLGRRAGHRSDSGSGVAAQHRRHDGAPVEDRQVRLRHWFTVVTSVLLLAAIGAVGVVVNRSALQAADDVHRSDSRALGRNNATLAGQFQLLSASELRDFAGSRDFALTGGSIADRAALARFAGRSRVFGYGAALTDLTGTLLTASRDNGLPALTDPGLAPMRAQLAAGQPGFSAVLEGAGVRLAAVGVPVIVGGAPAAVLVGFVELRTSQMQTYVSRLSAPGDVLSVVDGTGRIAAATNPAMIGTSVDPAIAARLRDLPADTFVEYAAGGTAMIAVVVGGLPGGWAYVRTQTRSAFDGAVRRRNQTTTLVLLAMLAVGGVGIFLLGRRLSLQRRRADQRFRALVEHAPDAVAVLDQYGRATFVSPSAAAAVGVAEEKLLGVSILDVVHPADRPAMQAHLQHLLDNPDAVLRLQCRIVRATGEHRWFEFTASNHLRDAALAGLVINARDVTDARNFQQRLAHQATHDSLTGLANRLHVQQVLRDALTRQQSVGVLFIDLDGFKRINDDFGHAAGDEVLRQVAHRLGALLRRSEVPARIGGDEFVVLMPGVVRWAEAEALRDQLLRAIEQPIAVGGATAQISASIGVHVATPADNPDHVLRAADHAMYAVKRARAAANAGAPSS